MAPSTTAAEPKVKAAKKALTGKRALIWIPDKAESGVRVENRSVLAAPTGVSQIRPQSFSWFDREATEARHNRHEVDPLVGKPHAHANAQPVIKTLKLNPGVTWIDAELWKSMHESSTPGDRIKGCIAEGSIIEPVLKDGLINLTGTIDDYENAEAIAIINETSDTKDLEKYQSSVNHRNLLELIESRIDLVQTRLAAATA